MATLVARAHDDKKPDLWDRISGGVETFKSMVADATSDNEANGIITELFLSISNAIPTKSPSLEKVHEAFGGVSIVFSFFTVVHDLNKLTSKEFWAQKIEKVAEKVALYIAHHIDMISSLKALEAIGPHKWVQFLGYAGTCLKIVSCSFSIFCSAKEIQKANRCEEKATTRSARWLQRQGNNFDWQALCETKRVGLEQKKAAAKAQLDAEIDALKRQDPDRVSCEPKIRDLIRKHEESKGYLKIERRLANWQAVQGKVVNPENAEAVKAYAQMRQGRCELHFEKAQNQRIIHIISIVLSIILIASYTFSLIYQIPGVQNGIGATGFLAGFLIFGIPIACNLLDAGRYYTEKYLAKKSRPVVEAAKFFEDYIKTKAHTAATDQLIAEKLPAGAGPGAENPLS